MRTPEEKQAAKLLKEQKKAYKKQIIEQYGRVYYLRDKTWINIKNQGVDESFAEYEKRLQFYGFTTDGVDIRTGKKHFAKATVNVNDQAYGQADAAEEAVAEETVAEETAAEESANEQASDEAKGDTAEA